MLTACFDLEGVFVPEVWIAVAKITGIQELSLTTRDIVDYNELMAHRLRILDAEQIGLKKIQEIIASIKPLDGAKEFLDWARTQAQVVILSDTFYQFADPLMAQLGRPTLFCHDLEVDGDRITGYRLRQQDSKRQAILAFRALNFKTLALGDSYNDTSMIQEADHGFFFRAPAKVLADFPGYPCLQDYAQIRTEIETLIQTSA